MTFSAFAKILRCSAQFVVLLALAFPFQGEISKLS
jgi:hypothetical protein